MAWTEITRAKYWWDASRHAGDLTDIEWALVAPLPPLLARGKKAPSAQLRNVARSLMSLFKRGLRRIQFCLQRRIFPPLFWAAWKTDGW